MRKFDVFLRLSGGGVYVGLFVKMDVFSLFHSVLSVSALLPPRRRGQAGDVDKVSVQKLCRTHAPRRYSCFCSRPL